MTLLRAVHRWSNLVLLAGAACSFVGVPAFAAIPAQAAVGTRVEVESMPAPGSGLEQEILDARAGRILFVERTPWDVSPGTAELKVKYRSSGEVVPVPSPPAPQLPIYGYLTDHGVIYVAESPVFPYARVWEWRDGTLIDHGGANSSTSLEVKGDYAIWNNGTFLYRRDLSLGQTITVAKDVGNVDNDVSSNGTVAYWTYDSNPDPNKRIYSVKRFRHGHTEQLTSADPTLWNTYPLTDGTNVVYRKTNHCCSNEQGSLAVSYDPGGELVLDSFRQSWPVQGLDYDIAGGWVAYTRVGPSGESFQIRVRDQDGGDSALSPPGMAARIADVSLVGEVMFHPQSDWGHLYLGKPGSELIDFGARPAGYGNLFRFGGNWYQSSNGTLYRLDVVGRPAITSGPSGATATTSAEFAFTAPGPSPDFECRLDRSEFASCPSPRNYSDLGDGEHRFEVKITGAGADPTPAERIWTVDSTPPADFALRQPGGGTTVDRDPVLSWDATSDATTGLEYYEIVLDGSTVGELDRTACESPTCSIDLPNPLPDGVHTWRVRALDAVGNVRESETRSFTVADPPTAALSVAPLLALTGEHVSFDASDSSDPNGTIVRFQWDLDGDGTFERDTGTDPRTTEIYADRLEAVVKVRVTDSGGLTAEAGQTLVVTRVSAAGRPGISINGGAIATNDRDVDLNLVWPTRAINAVISNDGGFQAPGIVPVGTPVSWRLESSGPQLLPKTVYVRFEGGESGRETYTDDIILDETRPTVRSATATPLGGSGSASASKARARRYRVRIRARDSVTGVKGLQVTNNRRRPGKVRKVRKARAFGGAIVFKSRGRGIYVRAQDGAGNFSRWRKARITR